MNVARIGDIAVTDAAHVLITASTAGTAFGYPIDSTDPTAQVAVPHHGDARIIAGTDRTRAIAAHMSTVGYWPSQMRDVNTELHAVVTGR